MPSISRALRVLFTIYAFLPFTAFLLLVFPLVVAASFFGKIKGGNFIYWLCQCWSDFVIFMLGIFHRNIFETPHDRNRQYVFVFNHSSFLDIPILFKAIRGQHFRVLGKAEMAKIPLFGFIYKNAVVMVERDNPENRAKSVKQLISVLKKGISVVISPEGTFNMSTDPLKEFYDGAFRIAIETQTPIKPILILDAYDRMHHSSIFSLNPGRSRAVYLEEISVEGLTLDDVASLKRRVYQAMEDGLKRYKASWINAKAGNIN
ncbi:MAG: 1-acyl-sn-glycerol-3-phosphate acyltransferase [Ferruginibacter sp.]|nr:1-acyl-sn-glycerol-3-phosphate acyltransferase [Ferruginibacter sp.]MBU9937442.1 1-acyl-sn-glycerol-3-phosphate acyltransferase [Ferruginibacter sp.]